MNARLNPFAAAPGPMKAWMDFGMNSVGIVDPRIAELVKIRASQINGCANCLAMHCAEARAKGETEERIWLLDAWREAPCYSEAERAALAWTEALTLIADAQASDPVYAELARHFSEEEQVALTLLIVSINGWSRIAIGFRLYDPEAGRRAARAAA
jgi:AhpD family alkylhydroperoxidase